MNSARKAYHRTPYLLLALVSPLGFAAVDSDADLNGDARITSLDISIMASCFNQDPLSNSSCTKADIDEDGDIDIDDYRFVSARLGETYPELLFALPQVIRSTHSISVSVGGLGDVNNDGLIDMLVNETIDAVSSSFTVFLGTGDGNFQPSWSYGDDYGFHGGCSAALSDVNGDGLLDIVQIEYHSDYSGRMYSVRPGNGDGSFQEPVAERKYIDSFHSIRFIDVNGDGTKDFVADDRLVLSNHDGTLQEEQYVAALSSISLDTFADVNGDGIQDAAGLSDGSILIMLGNGSGDFQEHQRLAINAEPIISIFLSDINRDDAVDIVYTVEHAIFVLLGKGDGSFQKQHRFTVNFYPSSTTLGDVNGDGLVDLVAFTNRNIFTLLGNGDGSFLEPQHFATTTYSINSINLGDFNGDSMLDLLITEGDYEYYDEFIQISVMLNRISNM
jgi:hypothetical protein